MLTDWPAFYIETELMLLDLSPGDYDELAETLDSIRALPEPRGVGGF